MAKKSNQPKSGQQSDGQSQETELTRDPVTVRDMAAAYPVNSVMDLGDEGNRSRVVTSFDVYTDEGLARLIEATNVADVRADQLDGEVFRLVDYCVTAATYQSDQEDVPRDGVRIVLWDDTGRTLATSSFMIGRVLDILRTKYGPNSFDPPIPLRIVPSVLPNGHRSFKVTLAGD